MKLRRRPAAPLTQAERIDQARVAADRRRGWVEDVHRRREATIAAVEADKTRLHVCPVWGCEHQAIGQALLVTRPGHLKCPEHNEDLIDTGVRAHELDGAR